MKIDRCEFPDDLLYDDEGLVWSRVLVSGDVVVGITSIYAALAGRITKITVKPRGASYAKGKAIGFLESVKYFGPIRAPVGGVLQELNVAVLESPRRLTDAAYADGWFARLHPTNLEDLKALMPAVAARETLAKQIGALRLRCFPAVPDVEMFEIGIECAAVLAKLNELLFRTAVGDVVHLVTDDPTAPIEMAAWSDRTGQPLIDETKEGNLFHFLVRKVS